MDAVFLELKKLNQELTAFDKYKIPLCAAETYVSPFVRQAYDSVFDGKYSMNNIGWHQEDDFIGSVYINELFCLVSSACKKYFGAEYADARTLSGMNCFAIVAQCLIDRGDKVLITTADQGGHPSVPLILDKLGIKHEEVPYDYGSYQIDYAALNELLAKGVYSHLILCQSDLLQPPELEKIDFGNTTLIYDGTQTLGMIQSGILDNPLRCKARTVLIGGTHKTLPGPTCGLIMANDSDVGSVVDKLISPSFLRNVQPNMIAAALLAMIEQNAIGAAYQTATVKTANNLARKLEARGQAVVRLEDETYTHTHQIFLSETAEMTRTIFDNAVAAGITLNKKKKKLFGGSGIRIGVQEIARYGWNDNCLNVLADVLIMLREKHPDSDKLAKLTNSLSEAKIPDPRFVLSDVL